MGHLASVTFTLLYGKQLDSIVVGVFPNLLRQPVQILLDDEVRQWMVSVCSPSKAQLMLAFMTDCVELLSHSVLQSIHGIHKCSLFTEIHRLSVL